MFLFFNYSISIDIISLIHLSSLFFQNTENVILFKNKLNPDSHPSL